MKQLQQPAEGARVERSTGGRCPMCGCGPDHDAALQRLEQAEAEREKWKQDFIEECKPPVCSCCAGAGTAESGPCICGGSGLEQDEVATMRLEYQHHRETLRLIGEETKHGAYDALAGIRRILRERRGGGT